MHNYIVYADLCWLLLVFSLRSASVLSVVVPLSLLQKSPCTLDHENKGWYLS